MSVFLLKYGEPKQKLLCWGETKVTNLENGQEARIKELKKRDQLVIFASSKSIVFALTLSKARISLLLREPRTIKPWSYWIAKFLSKRFRYILTYDDKLLATVKNARFMPHGGCWIKNWENRGYLLNVPKQKVVSIIASRKSTAEGHQLRHRIVAWAEENKTDLVVLGFGYKMLKDKAIGHSSYTYSVIIENSRVNGYFTEKLIDCIICGSIPIYWGAPNIGEYFDTSGMIICETFEELTHSLARTSEINEKKFQRGSDANYVTAQKYADYKEQLLERIKTEERLRKGHSN